MSAIPFQVLFEFDNSGRTRGHSLKQRKKRCRLDLRLYFFSDSERVVTLWNCLGDQCVTATSLNSFKNNLSRLIRRSMGLSIRTIMFNDPLEAAQFFNTTLQKLKVAVFLAEFRRSIIDIKATDQWRPGLRACVRASGQHFEQLIN